MRFDHINIVVADMDRSVRFYTEVLGLHRGFETTLQGEWVEIVTGLPGAHARCVFLDADEPGIRLELLQYFTPAGAALAPNQVPNTHGLRHLAFAVGDWEAMEALYARLKSAAVPLVSEPILVPFQVGTLGRKKLFYFSDPDGVILEVAAYQP